MKETKTILVSCVGSLVGQTILDMLEGRRDRIRLVGTNSRADAAGNFRCDKAWLVPETADRNRYAERFAEILREEAPDLVIPGRDEDIPILAELRGLRPEFAPNLLVGSLDAAQIMDDKLHSARFASSHGLPFAETVATDDAAAQSSAGELLRRHGFPLIAKPRAGNGSRGVRVLLAQEQLDRILTRPGFVIQPMIDPPLELTPDLADGVPLFWGIKESRLFGVQVLIGPDGAIGPHLGFVATLVIGRCERLERCDEKELTDLGIGFAEKMSQLGWRGPFNLQCKRGPNGEFIPIEMNGRFSGGTSARRHLGFDEVAWTLNRWLGSEMVLPDSPSTKRCDVVVRSLTDFPIWPDEVASLVRGGSWSRRC